MPDEPQNSAAGVVWNSARAVAAMNTMRLSTSERVELMLRLPEHVQEEILGMVPENVQAAFQQQLAQRMAEQEAGGGTESSFAQAGRGGAGTETPSSVYPDWSSAGLFRPIGTYGPIEHEFLDNEEDPRWESRQQFTPAAGQTVNPDPYNPLYINYILQPGSEAERIYNERRQAIQQSLAEGQSTYRDLALPVFVQSARQETIQYSSGARPVARSRIGQFARKSEVLSAESAAEINEMVKGMLLENYDRLIGHGHGGEQTGALRHSLANCKPTVEKNGKDSFVVSIVMDDEPGEARPGSQAPRPSTGTYGKFVFQGRAAIQPAAKLFDSGTVNAKGKKIMARTFMRFSMHGEFITTTNVKASRTDLNVFSLTPAQYQKVSSLIAGFMTPSDALDTGAESGAAA